MSEIIDAEQYLKQDYFEKKQSEIIDADTCQQEKEIELGRVIIA